NCFQYDNALAVQARGLSFAEALCPDCPHRDDCDYRDQLEAAKASPHPVATLARMAVSLPVLAEGHDYITLHEQPLSVLRPTFVARYGLKIVALIAEAAGEGEDAHDANARGFYRVLARIAKHLHSELNGGNKEAKLPLPQPALFVPEKRHATLYKAS